jgi:hypothetical protein
VSAVAQHQGTACSYHVKMMMMMMIIIIIVVGGGGGGGKRTTQREIAMCSTTL